MDRRRWNQVVAAIERGEARGARAHLAMGMWAARWVARESGRTRYGESLLASNDLAPSALESCGTSLCLAGWACVLAGDPPRWEEYEDGVAFADVTESGRSIEEVAAEWLNADWSERELFYALEARTTDDLRDAADELEARGKLTWTGVDAAAAFQRVEREYADALRQLGEEDRPWE